MPCNPPLCQKVILGALQYLQGHWVQHQLQTQQHAPQFAGIPKYHAKKEETWGVVYRIDCEGEQEDIGNATSSMQERLKKRLRQGPRNTNSHAVHYYGCRNTCTMMVSHTNRSLWKMYRSSTGKMTRTPGASRSPTTLECSTQTPMPMKGDPTCPPSETTPQKYRRYYTLLDVTKVTVNLALPASSAGSESLLQIFYL